MKIVVAYDGTEGAKKAARDSLPLARASSATLLLLHVLNPRADAADVQALSTKDAMRAVVDRAEAEARDFIDGLYPDYEVRAELQDRGEDTGEAIARIAEAEEAELIAIATRRAGGLSGFFLGSVTQQVIRYARCPVLVVRI